MRLILACGIFLAGFGSLTGEMPKPLTVASRSQPRLSSGAISTFEELQNAALPRDIVSSNSVANPELAAPGAQPEVLLRERGLSFPELVSTNLRPTTPDPKEAEQLRVYQELLEQGRKLRKAASYEQAQQVLVRLMNMPVPSEFHRCALLELGLVAQDQNHLVRAQQIYSQYVNRFSEDPSVPEVLLRQGLLYRQMGSRTLALSKFYAVMSTSLSLKLDSLAYYQRLVLQAQTEIADTHYFEGNYEEAAVLFKRLLKQGSPDLNRDYIHYKLVRSHSGAKQPAETLTQAQLFAELHPDSRHLAEVRFLQAEALKSLGRKEEAIKIVLALVETQRATADANRQDWAYWQQRTGNELANQLYQEGDFVNALELYTRLGRINGDPAWRAQAWYQAALIYERLQQPQKADELYAKILEAGKDLDEGNQTASLKMILQMAQWRKERLPWQTKAGLFNQQLSKLRTKTDTTTP